MNLLNSPLHDQVGGEPFFEALVDRFYAGVEADPLLRPLYPEDLTDSKRHMVLFLVQYWGGPTTYSDQRGHPRLRARHMPFVITTAERDAWVSHMTAAIDGAEVAPEVRQQLVDYFDHAATFLINTADSTATD